MAVNEWIQAAPSNKHILWTQTAIANAVNTPNGACICNIVISVWYSLTD